jgi:hypothetical protein
MTFDTWNNASDHFFDFLAHSEIYSMPEWDGWKEQINNVLADMAYEDAEGCEFEDLINLAGLKGEIDKARKQHIEDKRMENMQEDF